MTVDDLIRQQAAKNSVSQSSEKSEERPDLESSDPLEDALFKMYHIKGYAQGPGFKIESF